MRRIFCFLAFLLIIPSGFAQEACSLESAIQQNDSWLINCSFSGGQDRITVYETKDDGQLDFADELWIFDANADDTANLIISFECNEQGLFARLYDDQNRNGAVEFRRVENTLFVYEGNFPTIEVKAVDGWWMRDGMVNYNLEIVVDGLVRSMFFMGNYQDGVWNARVIPDTWAEVSSDGNSEFLTRVYDTDYDGLPDYFTTELLIEALPQSSAVPRLEMVMNVLDNEAAPTDGAILWPYLGNSLRFIQDYHDNHAPIQMDWEHSILTDVGEFVASRGGENNFFIYSIAPLYSLDENGDYLGNFENPFAFYDLANDADGLPELQIRNEYSTASDRYFLNGIYPSGKSNIRYSWDQNNDGFWDYKVDLAGDFNISTVLAFDTLDILSIPYNDYPSRVIQETWGAISFVAIHNRNYVSTEGIYEGAISREVQTNYLTGFAEEYALALDPITVGMRLDYNLEALSQPYLYLSSVDYQLHLRGATEGLWFIADNPVEYLYYDDLNGDGYFDHWQHFIDESLELGSAGRTGIAGNALNFPELLSEGRVLLEELFWSGDKLIYYDVQAASLAIRQFDAETSLFETLPPRTHQDWVALNQLLNPLEDFQLNAGQLGLLFNQFDGALLFEGTGLHLSEIRAMPDGLRFLMSMAGDSSVSGELLTAPITGGTYIVELSQNLDVYPASVPDIGLSNFHYEPDAPRLFEASRAVWVLENSSMRDAIDMPIQIRSISPDNELSILVETTLTVLAGERASFSQDWYPEQIGQWTLELSIGAESFATVISVTDGQANFSVEDVFSLFGDVAGLPVLLMLLGMSLIPALLLLLIFRQGDKF